MNKMLVVVFDSETKAYEGIDVLRDLDVNGDITLYANAVVSRDSTGQLHIGQEADEGPIGTATGLFTGSLIGLLGGPIGMAVGAGVGAITGVAFDISKDDVSSAFVDEVSSSLVRGKSAVLAEIDESWTVPLDTRMDALGGIVFRRLRYEVAEDQLVREAESLPIEYRDMLEELDQAKPAEKGRISKAISLAEEKASVLNEQIRRKEDEAKRELDAKVSRINDQKINAGDRRRVKLQKRIDELKKNYLLRMDKLKQASGKLHEVFGLKEEIALPA
jgi:Predicted membrane protein